MDAIERYDVLIYGTRPLMHNRFFVEPKTSGKKVTQYIPTDEAKKKLYLKDGVPIVPAVHLEGAMINASKMFKWQGRKTLMDVFKSSVFVSPEEIPFAVPENSLDYTIDERGVRIGNARVLTWRPRWDDWKLRFEIKTFQPENLSNDQLYEVLEHAGNFVGIGDFRPKFGTFKIEEFKKL